MTRAGGFRIDFVGVGPQRNGTTWLHSVLERHPSLCLPSSLKETMFFDLHYGKGLEWYAAHFSHARPGQLCGEIAPTYFDAEELPARIRELNDACRILVSLRNPVEHATSLYRHHLGRGRLRGTFAECAATMPRIVDSGRYARHLPRWLDAFGAERVQFVWLDDVRSQPECVFREICRFLGIREISLPSVGHERVYAAKRARVPVLARVVSGVQYWLRGQRLYRIVGWGKRLGLERLIYSEDAASLGCVTLEDRRRLLDVFEPDIAFVEHVSGRDLSAWRRTGLSGDRTRGQPEA